MTSSDFNIVPSSREGGYYVDCHTCHDQFNASLAEWCRCEAKTRTLVCPHCSKCFCGAQSRFKDAFWANAPRVLRENANRFRVGDGPALKLAATAAAAPRVLIVDDEEDMRSLVACYVEQMGYSVMSVSSPADALLLLSTTAFDVVVTDALMPAMDGRELCQKLKEEYGDAIKVIVMTSLYTASRYKTEARYRFKVDEYLAKPLAFGVLKAAMDRVAPIR